jgi:predicted Zn-dependent peptidase
MSVLLLILIFLTLSFGGEKVHSLVLDNGVRLIIKETHGKGIVAGVIFIKSGVHGESKKGITNLITTLLTKGTKKYSSYDIASAFEDYGGSISANTTDDYVEIAFATKVEGLQRGLEVIRSMLYQPAFNEEDISREKTNIITAIRSKRERGYELAMEHLRALTFKGTDYEVSPLGKEEDIKSITKDDLINRWEDLLKGGNIVVSIVGDIQPEKVKRMIEPLFSEIPAGTFDMGAKDTYIQTDQVQKVTRPGAQATLLCAFNAPKMVDKDYYSFKVLVSALGNGMTSKLFKELREKKGYAYATYAYYPTRYFSPRMFAYVGTSPEKSQPALEDLVKVVQSSELTEEDVKLAKSKLVGDFLLDHQTRLKQAWYLGFYEIMGLGWKMDELYPEKIEKVSYQEVVDAQKKYLGKHQCVVVEP